jgi:hypothetical protein
MKGVSLTESDETNQRVSTGIFGHGEGLVSSRLPDVLLVVLNIE